ncbi:phosphatase PAP2 family protein [Thermococcus sp.]
MNSLRQRLSDPRVLIRLNAFVLSYFGWILFGILYGYIGRWSVNVTNEFLRLPLTSKALVYSVLDTIRAIPPLYELFRAVYYLGFAGSIGMMVVYLLLYLYDLETSDELLSCYLLAYAIAGLIYLTFHVYAPHVVYRIPGYSSENTLLTRQEFVLPSLHNTFAAINILTIWKYRKRLGGKVLIAINTLIPFATVFLAHHWVYDVMTGFLLAIAVSRVPSRWVLKAPEKIYNLEFDSLKAITMVNLLLALIVFIIALSPERWMLLIKSLLGQP